MKLLGKEVKVGTRVKTTLGKEARVVAINQHFMYPFAIESAGAIPYSVNEDGLYFDGHEYNDYNVVEVLDTQTGDTLFDAVHSKATELELKNYRLTLENELLAQEVQELRDFVPEIDFLNKRIDRLEAELTAFAASRDVWKELAEKYERILKGGS
jgi:uncharacterized small protein (DUF1192 family)